MPEPTCPTCGHPMRCPACTGGQGGRSTSPKKAAAAKVNASKPRAKARPARVTDWGDDLRGVPTG